jgi:TolB-like protein
MLLKKKNLLFLVFTMIICIEAFPQNSPDVIIMLNGEQKSGKVMGIDENTIRFKYSGEDLEYTFKKSEINKIQFASGRTEVINEIVSSTQSTNTSTAADRTNKLAVLPIEYITNDPSINTTGIADQIQFECVNRFKDETKNLKILDPMTTNSILAKNAISIDNFKTITPKELANILGVEYVVYGSFTVTNDGASTYGSSVTTYKDKEERDYNDSKRDTKSKGTAITSNSSSTRISYDTHFDMNIYNDSGENIYSDSRSPFGGDPEGYKGSVKYLVQHSPFGSKSKN